MLNPKLVRKDPELIKKKLKTRGIDPKEVDKYLDLDKKNRDFLKKEEDLRANKNKLNKKITPQVMKTSQGKEIINKIKTLNAGIKDFAKKQPEVYKKMRYIEIRLPNLPADDIPVGPDEKSNVEIRKWGKIPQFSFNPKSHWELGENLDILDFKRAVKISGPRFAFYKNAGAKLERALYNFMLDLHTEKQGYQEIIPPYLVTGKTMFGTGQFPKFKQTVYTVESTGETLIPTAEVPLTNYYSGEILKEKDLPIYFTAMSPCFRSESDSAGKDIKGLIRVHQFHKVEMVKFAKPEDSYDELEKLTLDAQEVLKKLGLAHHVIILSTGDMGFSSAKTYDIEVWMPEQNVYREISSCSNCLDFQARRAMIRYRDQNGKIHYVHTLNGSGLAVGRTVAAIMENYQQADGSIKIPKVLIPYMHGKKVIENKANASIS